MGNETALPECDTHLLYTDYECRNDVFFYQRWASDRPHLPYLAIMLYLPSIYAGQAFMKSRKPVNLKWLLFLWNAGLASLALIGVFRGICEVGSFLRREGFLSSMCFARTDNVTAFWVFVFLMSKFAELGDTFFLVAKKKNVMFLHWSVHMPSLFLEFARVTMVILQQVPPCDSLDVHVARLRDQLSDRTLLYLHECCRALVHVHVLCASCHRLSAFDTRLHDDHDFANPANGRWHLCSVSCTSPTRVRPLLSSATQCHHLWLPHVLIVPGSLCPLLPGGLRVWQEEHLEQRTQQQSCRPD